MRRNALPPLRNECRCVCASLYRSVVRSESREWNVLERAHHLTSTGTHKTIDCHRDSVCVSGRLRQNVCCVYVCVCVCVCVSACVCVCVRERDREGVRRV